jgi:hypothetical protein
MGYDTVMSVKIKLLSKEAVLTSKTKKTAPATAPFISGKAKDDEIALVSLTQDTNKDSSVKDTDLKEKT